MRLRSAVKFPTVLSRSIFECLFLLFLMKETKKVSHSAENEEIQRKKTRKKIFFYSVNATTFESQWSHKLGIRHVGKCRRRKLFKLNRACTGWLHLSNFFYIREMSFWLVSRFLLFIGRSWSICEWKLHHRF